MDSGKLEQLVFKYLDTQNFKSKKIRNTTIENVNTSYLFFTRDINSNFGEIMYDYWKGKLYITEELCDEIISFFSLDKEDNFCDVAISDWVGNKINKEISYYNISVMSVDSFIGEHIFSMEGK